MKFITTLFKKSFLSIPMLKEYYIKMFYGLFVLRLC